MNASFNQCWSTPKISVTLLYSNDDDQFSSTSHSVHSCAEGSTLLYYQSHLPFLNSAIAEHVSLYFGRSVKDPIARIILYTPMCSFFNRVYNHPFYNHEFPLCQKINMKSFNSSLFEDILNKLEFLIALATFADKG